MASQWHGLARKKEIVNGTNATRRHSLLREKPQQAITTAAAGCRVLLVLCYHCRVDIIRTW